MFDSFCAEKNLNFFHCKKFLYLSFFSKIRPELTNPSYKHNKTGQFLVCYDVLPRKNYLMCFLREDGVFFTFFVQCDHISSILNLEMTIVSKGIKRRLQCATWYLGCCNFFSAMSYLKLVFFKLMKNVCQMNPLSSIKKHRCYREW